MRAILPVILVLLGILAVSLWFIHTPLLLSISNFLAVRSLLEKGEIVHVISGADARADYGIELVKAGYAPKIFFTGGWCDEIDGYHGERGRQRALAQGVAEAAIAIDDSKVVSTYEEALRLKAYLDMQSEPTKSIIVVSDPFHMRRVSWTYGRIFGPTTKIILAPVPFEKTPFNPRWWQDSGTARNVGEEYAKLGYSLLRYQFASGWFKKWLASLDVK